jgi:hypothetical protein
MYVCLYQPKHVDGCLLYILGCTLAGAEVGKIGCDEKHSNHKTFEMVPYLCYGRPLTEAERNYYSTSKHFYNEI